MNLIFLPFFFFFETAFLVAALLQLLTKKVWKIFEDIFLVKETGILMVTDSCFFHIWQQGGKQEVCYVRTVT